MTLEGFFQAKSIAVVGAAREEQKVGHTLLKNLLQNKNLRVFPVNPNATEILGAKCYSNLLEIKENIELVIIAVKSDFVLQVLKDSAKKKIKNVIIVTAGFAETGNKDLEEQIKKIAHENKITLLGPNVMGTISPKNNFNASFFDGIPKKGNIAFLSQSGALGTAILDWSIKENIGLSGFASLGNLTQLDFSDFIEYFSQDKETKVIALYMESLKAGNGKKFIETCKKCKKPIVILKAGKSEAGSKAAMSHTAALASEKGVYESMFKQAGIIEAENITQVFRISEIIATYEKLGKRACIITNAGGPGVLTTDYLSANKIEIPALPENIKEKLNKILPKEWSHNNPIDVLGDALNDRYQSVLANLDKENFFDFFLVLLTPQHMTKSLETAQTLTKLKKPTIAVFMGGNKIQSALEFLKQNNIPVFSEPEDASKVLGKIINL